MVCPGRTSGRFVPLSGKGTGEELETALADHIRGSEEAIVLSQVEVNEQLELNLFCDR